MGKEQRKGDGEGERVGEREILAILVHFLF